MAFDIISRLKVTGIAATDDWIAKRAKAINQLGSAFRKLEGAEALSLAGEIVAQLAKGFHPLSEALRAEVFTAVRKAAPQYVPDKRGDAELGLCAVLAAVVAVDGAGTNDFHAVTPLACAILSGAQFVPKSPLAQLELIRREIVQLFGDLLHDRAVNIRGRSLKPAASIPTAKPEEAVETYVGRIISSVQTSIDGLQANAMKDREELDLLWWKTNAVGLIAPGRFSAMSSGLAAVCAGLEVASMMAQPVASDAHRAIASSVLPPANIQLTLADVIAAIHDHSVRVRATFANGVTTINRFPSLFPLLFALSTVGTENAAAQLAAARVDQKIQKSADVWCARAVDEALLLARLGFKTSVPRPERA